MTSKVVAFLDNGSQCWSRLALAHGEPCWISVAQTGVIVKRSKLGLFGATLYKETDAFRAAMTAKALRYVLPTNLLPDGFRNPVLSQFTNAALACNNSAELSAALGSAISVAEKRAGLPISAIPIAP